MENDAAKDRVLIALILSLLLPIGPRTECVDVIELNHIYAVSRDDAGRWYARHHISFYDFWCETPEGLHIRDWVSYKAQPLIWDGAEPVLLCEGAKGTIRIRGKTYTETLTGYDRETVDRETWPAEKRKRIEGLRK